MIKRERFIKTGAICISCGDQIYEASRVFSDSYTNERGCEVMKVMSLAQKLSMNKKGVLGMDSVRDVIIFLLTLAVAAIAVFLALSSLQDANLFTASSTADNNTDYIINNITNGASNFFEQVPTIFTVLGAVAIILAVTLILFAVNRFSQSSTGL